MIRPEFLTKFNATAKIKHGEFVTYVNRLRPFEEMIKVDKTETKSDKKVDVTPEIMKIGEEMREKIALIQEEIKDKLLTVFFSLNQEEFDDLDFEEAEEMTTMILNSRPSLINFLFLPPIQTKSENGLETTNTSAL
jgi:hypothetical protein